MILLIMISITLAVIIAAMFVPLRGSCDLEIKHVKYTKLMNYESGLVWKSFNPSICKYKDGYMICYRCGTCSHKNIIATGIGKIYNTSHIKFMQVDNKFDIINISDPIFDIYRSSKNSIIPSMEDPRIIFHDNHFYVSTTLVKAENIFPVLYVFDREFKCTDILKYSKSEYFKVNEIGKVQKNWCPFIHQGCIYIHTDSYPSWQVWKLTKTLWKCVIKWDSNAFFDDDSWSTRCSTSWKEYTHKTYICAVHLKKFGRLSVTIRTVLVEIDKQTLIPLRRTKLLCLSESHDFIQFASGLEVDSGDVIIALGVNDYKFVITRIKKKDIRWLHK